MQVTISDMMTRTLTRLRSQPLPDNPERTSAVIGYQHFKSGKHFWDVKVEHTWALGVVEESNKQCGSVWGIARDIYLIPLTPDSFGCADPLAEKSFLQTVRVQLDCDQRTLSFIDLDKMTTVHTLKIEHTIGKSLFPYFEGNVKILPAKLP